MGKISRGHAWGNSRQTCPILFKLLLSRRRMWRSSCAAPVGNLPAAAAAPDTSLPIGRSRDKKTADAMSDVIAEEENEGRQEEEMPSSAAAAQVGCPKCFMMA